MCKVRIAQNPHGTERNTWSDEQERNVNSWTGNIHIFQTGNILLFNTFNFFSTKSFPIKKSLPTSSRQSILHGIVFHAVCFSSKPEYYIATLNLPFTNAFMLLFECSLHLRCLHQHFETFKLSNWMTCCNVVKSFYFMISHTHRDFRPNMERNQERNRLRIYKIYAFGVPLLISGIAAMRHSSSTPGDEYSQPRFCETEYWFAGKSRVERAKKTESFSCSTVHFFGGVRRGAPNLKLNNGPAIMKWNQQENPRQAKQSKAKPMWEKMNWNMNGMQLKLCHAGKTVCCTVKCN